MFPPDIWSLVLRNLSGCTSQAELIYLWTSVHLVKRLFKSRIEEHFQRRHINKTWIHIGYGMYPLVQRHTCAFEELTLVTL